MNKKLYAMMDWAAIEELVYGECDRPDALLGAHNKGRQTLVQAHFPGAEHVSLLIDGGEGSRGRTVKEEIPMEKADDAGFFAALLSGTDRHDYRYHVEYSRVQEGKKKKEVYSVDRPEVYGFGRILSEEEERRFIAGGAFTNAELLGAHKKTVRGVRGCIFRVWAPEAVRVSLIGEFNDFDGMLHPMNRLPDSGIFELFMPGVEEGAVYAYEVLIKGGVKVRKADPLSRRQKAPSEAESIVCEPSHKWKDSAWMEARKKYDPASSALNIYTVPADRLPEGFFSDKEAVAALADYVSAMGYSHVEFLPLMEYPKAADAGYHSLLFYAFSSRFGRPEDLCELVDVFHRKSVGVLLDWAPADFSNMEYGLGSFDGSPLYEYTDPRRGVDPRTGMLMFDLEKPQVRDYLLSALRFWAVTYHIDGFVTLDTAALLYLDYYRKPGEWVSNIYGGVENLEALDFFREMNRMLHGQKSGLMSIAAQAGSFPRVTGTEEDALGFDLVTDSECIRELVDYLSHDPIVRSGLHQELVASTLYQYCEHYIIPVSLSNVNFHQGGLRMRMHGEDTEQWKSLMLLYAYQLLHVGKKSCFMGQEYGELASYEDMARALPSEKKELEAEAFRSCLKQFYALYRKENAFHGSEDSGDAFVWLLENASDDNVLAFLRQDGKKGHSFVCVLHFANIDRDKYFIPVTKEGKYRLVFSSTEGNIANGAVTAARKNGSACAIRVQLPALSARIWQFIPFTAEEKAEISRREEERERKRREEAEARKKLKEERVRLRLSYKDELKAKIAAVEAAVRTASEKKDKGKKQ